MKELENCPRDPKFDQTDKCESTFHCQEKPIISKCLTHCIKGQ